MYQDGVATPYFSKMWQIIHQKMIKIKAIDLNLIQLSLSIQKLKASADFCFIHLQQPKMFIDNFNII